MKLLKMENENKLKIMRVHHVRRYSLTLDRDLCKGCEICKIICPREAIELKIVPKLYYGEKAKPPVVDISEEKCSYCGMCHAICPFGAIKVEINGEHVIPVVKTESFPQLIREMDVDTTKCEVGCVDCEKSCPLNLIEVRKTSPVERAREILRSRRGGDATLKPLVNIELSSCVACQKCAVECPQKAISMRKFFLGTIKINSERCPRGCHDCIDVCPIPDALHLSEDGKINTNDAYCVYCGVCKIVCPEEGALELKRTIILHTPVRSGAWNRALEKLTSTKELAKELRIKSSAKTRDSVKRRLA